MDQIENKTYSYLEITNKNKSTFFNYSQLKALLTKHISPKSENNSINLIETFINKYIPNYSYSKDKYLTVSKAISKFYFKTQSIHTTEVEQSIVYLLDNQRQFNKTLTLNKEAIVNIGKILLYVYKKIDECKIKQESIMMEYINDAKENNIDVNNDYYQYLKEPSSTVKLGRIEYWKEQRKKNVYQLPPELLFLVCYFYGFKNIKIALESFTHENELRYLSIILINLEVVFSNVKCIECVFINEPCIKNIYQLINNKMNKKGYTQGKFLQKFNYINETKFKHTWNFDSNYISNSNNNIITNKSVLKISQLLNLNQSTNSKETASEHSQTTKSGLNSLPDFEVISSAEVVENKMREMLEKYILIFEAIIIISYFISKNDLSILSLSLMIPESFTREIKWILKESLTTEIENFDIYDIYSSLITSLKILKLEFNCLSSASFEKVFQIIYQNKKLQQLSLSLFPPEVYYKSTGLFRIAEEAKINPNQIFEKKLLTNQNQLSNYDVRYVILNYLMPELSKNLTLLLYLLVDDNSLNEISLFIDLPSCIYTNHNYIMMFNKFLINILLLLTDQHSKYKSVKLLSPSLSFNSKTFPDIENILEEINIKNKNFSLQKLYLQIQFYSITNIKYLISSNLLEINLSELDACTLQHFTKEFTSNSFTSQSRLQALTIGLLGFITDFNEVKASLYKLNRVCMKVLSSINIISNLVISQQDYEDILNMHSGSFVFRITYHFNKFSQKAITEYKKNKEQILRNKLYYCHYHNTNCYVYYNTIWGLLCHLKDKHSNMKLPYNLQNVMKKIKLFLLCKGDINFIEHYK